MRKMLILLFFLFLLSPVYLLSFNVYTGLQMTTWKKAQAFCREHHTDLVTIKNEHVNQHLLNVGGWIGLHRENKTSPWKWARRDERAMYMNWFPGEPTSGDHCAFKLWGISDWASMDCDYNHHFICYNEELVLVVENKTWEEALNYCRTLKEVDTNAAISLDQNHRYDLATLISPGDHTYARKLAQEATTDEVWTGLRFLAGHWFWASGEPMQYKDIQSCPSVGSCGVLEKSGSKFFKMKDCEERKNFICYRKP